VLGDSTAWVQTLTHRAGCTTQSAADAPPRAAEIENSADFYRGAPGLPSTSACPEAWLGGGLFGPMPKIQEGPGRHSPEEGSSVLERMRRATRVPPSRPAEWSRIVSAEIMR